MSSWTSVSPQSQGAQTPYHWHCLLAFRCNNHNCYSRSNSARGISDGCCARKGAIRRPFLDGFIIARSLEYPRGRGDRISTVPRVLPEKQGGTERVLPERLARPIPQACTSIAVQPAVKVLVPRRAPRIKLKNFRASRTPRASSQGFHAKNKNTF